MVLLGWLVWAVLTFSIVGVSAWWAGVVLRDRHAPERVAATTLFATGGIVLVLRTADLIASVRPLPVALVALVFVLAAARVANHFLPFAEVAKLWGQDARRAAKVPRALIAEREATGLLLAFGAAVALVIVWMVVTLRSWQWDPQMYHTTIIGYIVQDGSLGWVETHFSQAQGFPRVVHLIAAWNCLFPPSSALDDSGQLPFVLLGVAVIAAWARRFELSPAASAATGAAWLLFPAVALQAPSPHVDTACGALFAAAVYFAFRSLESRDRWLMCIALGLYAGAKHTGLFHLALLSPVVLARVVLELRATKEKRRRLQGQVASFVVLAALGLPKYVQNYLVMGNPTWPFRLKVPLTGVVLPGVTDPSAVYGGPPGITPYFFGIPGEFTQWLKNLVFFAPVYWPDVREDFFGPGFTFVLLPSLVLCLGWLLRRKPVWMAAPVLLLFVAAMGVPSAYWGRYSMGASIAGLAAYAFVRSRLRWPWAQRAVGLALTLGVGVGAGRCVVELARRADSYGYPKHVFTAAFLPHLERVTLQIANWNADPAFMLRKEQALEKGDVFAYDEGEPFLGELFPWDYRARLVTVRQAGVTPQQWLARIRELDARLVAVRRGSVHEATLRLAENDAELIGTHQNEAYYLRPRRK